MKKIFTLSIAILGVINLLCAQKITALQLMRYVGCKTSNCYSDGILKAGFTYQSKKDNSPGVIYTYSSTEKMKKQSAAAAGLYGVAFAGKVSKHSFQIYEEVGAGVKWIILDTYDKTFFEYVLEEFKTQGAFTLTSTDKIDKKAIASFYKSDKFPGYSLKVTDNGDKNNNTYQFRLDGGPTPYKMDSWENNATPAQTVTKPTETKPAVVETPKQTTVVADAPPVAVSDVDINIPNTAKPNEHKYALIIGNEDYSSFQTDLGSEVNVDFAVNDAEVFKKYCIQTLGVPAGQIKFIKNGTTTQIKQGLNWINNLAKLEGGDAEVIFYYSGHGLPDDATKDAYLMPVDVSALNLEDGIKLDDVYLKLTEHPAKKVMVLLDACFSGGARNKGLVAMKGSKLRPRDNTLAGNLVVLSSSTGDESSGVYRTAQHGYFTYFLLKKLQETKGDVTLKELQDYVKQKVLKQSTLESRPQTPSVNYSPTVNPVWENWKLK